MSRFCLLLLAVNFLALSSLSATKTRSNALGIEGRYWSLEQQLPYLFENPAFLFSFANRAYAEYDGLIAEGGFIFAGTRLGLGIFSGSPANEDQLNSALPPAGMYYTGGANFSPFVATGAGLTLDAAATNPSAGFGNLNSRVSRLDDAGDNRLRQKNLSLILAFGNAQNAFALLTEYGVASDSEIHDGLVEENLSLLKSQTTLGLGFVSSPGKTWHLLDGSLQVNYFNIENRYLAKGLAGESLKANFGTSGAYDLSLALRLGFRLGENTTLYSRLGGKLMDYSSQATAEAAHGVLAPGFDLADTYSRTGYYYSAGFSLKQDMLANQAFLLFALALESSAFYLVCDSRDYQNSLYNEYPLQLEATYLRLPFVVAMEAKVSEAWQVRFSLQKPLVALPEEGYILWEIEQYRSNTSFADITYREKTARLIQSSGTTLAIGFSYLLANFTVDWLTTVSLLRQGPNFISGKQEDLAFRVALTYNFNSFF